MFILNNLIESQTVKHLPVSIENWANTMIYLNSFPVILTNWWRGQKKKPPKTLPNTTPKKKRSPSIFRRPTAFHSMKKDPFMPATFFCSSYAANYDWTTSAETSGITGRSPTIFTLFSRTLYTQESFLPPANWAVMPTARHFWSRQNIPCTMYTVHFRF